MFRDDERRSSFRDVAGRLEGGGQKIASSPSGSGLNIGLQVNLTQ